MGDPGLAALRKKGLWGRSIARVVACVVLAITMHPAAAVDGVSISAGADDSGNANVDLYRVGVQWNWKKRWLQTENWHLGGYWDLQGGYWDNSSQNKTNSGLWELAFTPVFRVHQFGSHVGIGARFGNKDAFELSYRYQHISNASIKHPNNGINFNILRVGYWF
jgi:lipid A 3-O-deacylase